MSGTHKRSRLNLVLAGLVAAGLSGCTLLPEKIDQTKGWSAAQLYSEAKDALNEGNYTKAIEYYDKLQARYPFGRYAQQAQIETVYAYYKDSEPDSAIAAADRFIKTYPRHPYVDYVYYLRGLVNFNRATGPLDRLMPPDPTRTDTSAMQESFGDFNTVVTRYPDSKYAKDARQRMLFLRNNLANYEVNVANFYYQRGAYVAAANRSKYVLEHYASSPAAPDALAVMTRAYAAMGMTELARDTLRVLQRNAPGYTALPELSELVAGKS